MSRAVPSTSTARRSPVIHRGSTRWVRASPAGAGRAATYKMAWGSRTVSAEHGIAAGRDIRDSPINIVNGIPPEQVTQLVGLAVWGRPGDYTELLRRLDAMIPAESR